MSAGAWRGLTRVAGLRAGHAEDPQALTGCTVVLCEQGAVGGVDVRGAAPGTRETDLLRPGNLVDRVHAVLLTGGSAFGLDAAAGVMAYLEERGIGFDTGIARVPIVCAAVLYDLALGDPRRRPDAAMGRQACEAAHAGPVAEGNAGAGTGATVGKLFGMPHAMKGGVGTWSLALESGVTVGALAAVNAVGDVVDPKTGRLLAGTRNPATGVLIDSTAVLLRGSELGGIGARPGQNTTIAVVATDAILSKDEANRVAQVAHDGIARGIRPAHTMYDGDTVFALATGAGRVRGDVNAIAAAAAEVLAIAIARAVLAAHAAGGVPAARDLGAAGLDQ